jgi:hypothetical protein
MKRKVTGRPPLTGGRSLRDEAFDLTALMHPAQAFATGRVPSGVSWRPRGRADYPCYPSAP